MPTRDIHHSQTATGRLADHEAHWRRFGVNRASQQASLPVISSGWSTLDRLLPGGGFPLGAVTELLVSDTGIGEFTLLLACLAARLKTRPHYRIALVSPPGRLNAPALATAGLDLVRIPIIQCRDDSERLWCVEQMARSQAFVAFVIWGDGLDYKALRRLQLAAEQAACPVFVYRRLNSVRQRSPAALRLALTQRDGRQQLEILKCRGPAGACLSGLCVTRDTPWRMPNAAPTGIETQAACNDEYEDNDPLARPVFSPLGTR